MKDAFKIIAGVAASVFLMFVAFALIVPPFFYYAEVYNHYWTGGTP